MAQNFGWNLFCLFLVFAAVWAVLLAIYWLFYKTQSNRLGIGPRRRRWFAERAERLRRGRRGSALVEGVIAACVVAMAVIGFLSTRQLIAGTASAAEPARPDAAAVTVGERVIVPRLEHADRFNPPSGRFDRSCSLKKGDGVRVEATHGDYVLLAVQAIDMAEYRTGLGCRDGEFVMMKKSWYVVVRQLAFEEAARDEIRREAEEEFKKLLPPEKRQ